MLAIIYSDGSQECDRVVALFESLRQEYIEYKLNTDFTLKQFIEEFGVEAEFPQVAIGINHVGGLKETLQYYQQRNVL